MSLLHLANRQKTRALDRRWLRRIARCLLEELLRRDSYELCLHLIDATEMARLNETFLHHHGSTDVITFNHQEIATAGILYGEIFISVDDALLHARRLGLPWQWEMARYLAHGLLHLEGCDDTSPGPRRIMKRRENKLVKELSRRFDLGKLGRGGNGVERQ
jgi:probable rRNA maturation factor